VKRQAGVLRAGLGLALLIAVLALSVCKVRSVASNSTPSADLLGVCLVEPKERFDWQECVRVKAVLRFVRQSKNIPVAYVTDTVKACFLLGNLRNISFRHKNWPIDYKHLCVAIADNKSPIADRCMWDILERNTDSGTERDVSGNNDSQRRSSPTICNIDSYRWLSAYGQNICFRNRADRQPRPLVKARGCLSRVGGRFATTRNAVGIVRADLGSIGGSLRGVSEGFRLFGQRFCLLSEGVCVFAAGVHFSELPAHHSPLEDCRRDRAESEERYSRGQANHPTLTATNFVLESAYLPILLAVGYGLCLAASRIIFRWWNMRAFSAAAVLYIVVVLILIHALSLIGGR
jgi:hypothetical protein